ncbi:ATP-binding cassette domain-containing protein [Mesorhizobium sp. RP14(2022)]|uniref:ATP-binding cassette domain-containing protein n=1 Tax=Mesorhizobium liriopis TaxID=2953882 RepID=A0ABT1C5Q9_9HYPH|nr:ATP-binding cassette domain-containing protein [Mesorhizobium liriopis]MCO6050160.1 ATP-binding cassette domain-containing protein [Mesorhizobium liriopis]
MAISDAVTAMEPGAGKSTWETLYRAAAERGAKVLAPRDTSGVTLPVGLEKVRIEAPVTDKSWQMTQDGLNFDVGPGERTRLWIQLPTEISVWVHMLIQPAFSPAAEPVAALRYLHDNDPEEVALRFRRSGVVVHKEVEIPMPAGRPMFFSIGVFNGILHLHLNGVPVYVRPARHPSATSFMLDVIGLAEGISNLHIPFLAVEAPDCFTSTVSEIDSALLATGYLEAARHSSVRHHLHETLHSLASARLAYDRTDVVELIGENRRAEGPFRDVLDDLLLDRLPDTTERQTLAANRPTPVIRVRDVSIELASNPAGKTFSDLIAKRRHSHVRLLHNLSFDGFSGDIIGIIGRNGAGKTTFLKSLVGAIPIAAGRIDIEERPILLRPGAGMQPDLTGRQNIYKTGLYMNMTMSEIDAMIDDVVRFAELEDHIDRPFKYYSDGMRARLIFSMATAMPRDILLLDELLSAGDMGFQERAMKRLHDFLARSKLVFVVQHTFDFVLTRCTKCLLLEKGIPVYFGEPRIATELYRELL